MKRLMVVVFVKLILILGAQPLAAQEASQVQQMSEPIAAQPRSNDRLATPVEVDRPRTEIAMQRPTTDKRPSRIGAAAGMGLLGGGAGFAGAAAVIFFTLEPALIPLLFVAPAAGSALGVHLVGPKFGGQGAAWATGLGAVAGSAASLVATIAYLEGPDMNLLTIGAILAAGPTLGAIVGYEVSHTNRLKMASRPVVMPTLNVDSAGKSNPAVSMVMRF